MSVSKTYNPKEVENKWYQEWEKAKVFASKPNPDKKPFTIVIPPPNVTGVLHMGHMLNNTIQDVLTRKARMEGKEACWVPGTDHASIATETKVIKLLEEKGIKKSDLTRAEFLEHAYEWKDKYGGIILKQLKTLGASCDWDRTAFTMDKGYSKSVIKVFVDLYNKGYIYRGARMVNWDPKGLTALSDEEVIHKEVDSRLFYVRYQIAGSEEFLTIATTRPETILGDSAICVNPNDERYKHLHGKKAIVPISNKEIPIILDEYVDLEFGTGCLKVTPAHDINDYELGVKHKLESIEILNDNGTLNKNGLHYEGEDRFVVRKKIIKELETLGQFDKAENIKNNVGYSERTDVPIEPKISTQWFCKMEDMAKPALENVENDTIKVHPPKFKNMYRSWMENVRDWCISRQLWWGHQIPAFYLPNGEFVVAETNEEALALAQKIDSSLTLADLTQDNDVLDTWFSSWLWPMSVFDGINNPDNEEINYYYPTDVLATGFDIIFFWVARMIMAGYEYKGELPFKNVYITGMVRDEKGRKMSKSLGNSPDPLDLIDQYSADGVRVGMLLTAPAGNDLLFDEKQCHQGNGFAKKIWNAYLLVDGWEIDQSLACPNEQAIQWLDNRINEVVTELEDSFSKFRLSDALMSIYKLVWDDFCSWYLEMIKPDYQAPIDPKTLSATKELFEKIIKLVHPFMPFITEELWANIKERKEGDFITIAQWPETVSFDKPLLKDVEFIQELVTGLRNFRASKNILKKDSIEVSIKTDKDPQFYTTYDAIIKKLANVSSIELVSEKIEGAFSIVIGSDEFFIPLGDSIDIEAEKEKIVKEIDYTKGFLKGVDKKLSNERFVAGAPEQVIANERKKKEDAEAKLKTLEESLASLV